MKIAHHKIARLILTQSLYGKNRELNGTKIEKGFDAFLAKTLGKLHFDFLVMPGGSLRPTFPEELVGKYSIEQLERKHLDAFFEWGDDVLGYFFYSVIEKSFVKLKSVADYLTVGIDCLSPSSKQHIELVAVCDLKRDRTAQWTGKFYPTEKQKNDLVKINDLNTHFIKLNGQNVVILGCHDLMVFHPRGQAKVTSESWKGKISHKFKQQCVKFEPDIVLQHPHNTDTPNIWNLAWKTMEKELPTVKHYASGIYYPKADDPREKSLDKILDKTKKGDVLDFVLI